MTAIEWLEKELADNLKLIILNNDSRMMEKLFEQALEMEKQQIIEAHGDKLKISSGTTSFEYWLTGEDYYKKQFNK